VDEASSVHCCRGVDAVNGDDDGGLVYKARELDDDVDGEYNQCPFLLWRVHDANVFWLQFGLVFKARTFDSDDDDDDGVSIEQHFWVVFILVSDDDDDDGVSIERHFWVVPIQRLLLLEPFHDAAVLCWVLGLVYKA
jgi:hypothetical protein